MADRICKKCGRNKTADEMSTPSGEVCIECKRKYIREYMRGYTNSMGSRYFGKKGPESIRMNELGWIERNLVEQIYDMMMVISMNEKELHDPKTTLLRRQSLAKSRDTARMKLSKLQFELRKRETVNGHYIERYYGEIGRRILGKSKLHQPPGSIFKMEKDTDSDEAEVMDQKKRACL